MTFSYPKFRIFLKLSASFSRLEIRGSGDFLETFENVDNLYVVLFSNQVSSKSQPSKKASGDFLETFENVDILYVVLVSNQVLSKSQPI